MKTLLCIAKILLTSAIRMNKKAINKFVAETESFFFIGKNLPLY